MSSLAEISYDFIDETGFYDAKENNSTFDKPTDSSNGSVILSFFNVVTLSSVEITIFENYIVVYKFSQDVHFYVTGDENENEIILASVLQGFLEAVGIILKGSVDKREILENLDLILLCVDEIVDGGGRFILETDGNSIADKAASHSRDSGSPLSEQTLTQALAVAREHLARSLLR
ncbi:coatomer subunit zeta-2-like isoform X3 [Andrographis paniculata]|uniref:coatomer subunit zeta-2-like isoform X3 n=1 Tax=Andrographis paniculata TaxID=175694 RepID=UPI0021E89BBF|nr:coatomer subunit zeta-2-like isoform X3 [Andrographis paniculata]